MIAKFVTAPLTIIGQWIWQALRRYPIVFLLGASSTLLGVAEVVGSYESVDVFIPDNLVIGFVSLVAIGIALQRDKAKKLVEIHRYYANLWGFNLQELATFVADIEPKLTPEEAHRLKFIADNFESDGLSLEQDLNELVAK